jgi:hypothetical protein
MDGLTGGWTARFVDRATPFGFIAKQAILLGFLLLTCVGTPSL